MVRILCVDDNEGEFQLIERNLKRSDKDLHVKWVQSGSEALDELQRSKYDCILADFVMPGMDGLELLRALRGSSNDTPFIFLTAHGSEELAAKTMRLGADDYFTKDVGTLYHDNLASRIKSLAKLHELQSNGRGKEIDESVESSRQLIKVLQDHKAELELQNQQLRRAQQQLEAARDKYTDLFDFAPIGYYMIGSNGLIREVNLAGAVLLGLDRNTVEGCFFTNYISREYQEAFEEHRRSVLESKKKQVCEIELVKANGAHFPALLESNVVQSNDGEYVQFRTAISDITKRKQAEAELKASHARLEEQTRLLTDTGRELETFAYTVSHDLKAPLRRISSWIEILIDGHSDGLNDKGREYLSKLDENSREMCRLVDVLLNFSRLLRTEIKRESVDISKIARIVAAELRSDQPDRKSEFMIAEGLTDEADRKLVQVVIENLIGNAWKYTSREPKALIEFGQVTRNGQPAYFVRDNGVGFNPAYADRLFIAFQRLHENDEFEGLGIGLATVQRIVHRHGGRVWAEGEEGAGATFYFTLR